MTSMIRPELVDAAMRRREALGGAVVASLGLYFALVGVGILTWIGALLVFIGVLMVVTGLQKARFRNAGDGPGVVQVTEGEIAYFGPRSGGLVATDLLEEVALVTDAARQRWVLTQQGETPLSIPVDARGAEALFDAFAALPGLATGDMLRALETSAPGYRTVWRKPARLPVLRLEAK